MANDNYLILNGKRIDLTEDQIKTLFGEAPDSDKPKLGETYWSIGDDGRLYQIIYEDNTADRAILDVGNYCGDYDIMQQRAWFEALSRKLWKFSMRHSERGEDDGKCYFIRDDSDGKFQVNFTYCNPILGAIYFNSHEAAAQAIDEVILPFLEEHPNFKLFQKEKKQWDF